MYWPIWHANGPAASGARQPTLIKATFLRPAVVRGHEQQQVIRTDFGVFYEQVEDQVTAVPQRKRQAKPLLIVAHSRQTVLPQRYAWLRAWSCGKYSQAVPSEL